MPTILPIVLHPDFVLREKCVPVDTITDEIRSLLDDMLATMYDADGIGLAAPQIGITKRIVVLDVEQTEEGPGNPIKMINPEIISSSETKTSLDEGCLSLPTMRVEVLRPETVTVRYMDENGTIQQFDADDLLSKAVQHELDHLDGILIFDHISKLKRDIVLRRYQKNLRHG